MRTTWQGQSQAAVCASQAARDPRQVAGPLSVPPIGWSPLLFLLLRIHKVHRY
jgi:hypothetical protein